MVLPEVYEVEDISVPGFDVNCEGAGLLVASLVDVTGGHIICSKHRDDTIGVAIGACNIGSVSQVNGSNAKRWRN